ncbi:MAG TPA: hypothetical protein VHI52_10495, partial [Verrucomicrobiae bacterium]|nr:hypothetical protein [Verrucomicrobiae bacterium]
MLINNNTGILMASNHAWKFFRAGGFDQVKLESGADLMALDQLDQKLWVALACPTTGLEFDGRTLALIDTDQDGRIRAPELMAAVKWAGNCLKNPHDLLKGAAELPLSAISDTTDESRQILASARQILLNLGKKEATGITLEDVADTAKIFAQTHFNGDGIIPVDSAENEATKRVIADIIACHGAETDRSGKPGVSQGKVNLFFADAQAFSDWWKKAESDPAVLALDKTTAAAVDAVRAVRVKIDDYFTRCQLAAFDARSINALNREEKEYLALTAKDLTLSAPEIAGLPLAQVAAGKALPLEEGLNPAWAAAMAKFRTEVAGPILGGKNSMTEADWASVCGKLAPYDGWAAAKAGGA